MVQFLFETVADPIFSNTETPVAYGPTSRLEVTAALIHVRSLIIPRNFKGDGCVMSVDLQKADSDLGSLDSDLWLPILTHAAPHSL